MTTRNSRAAAKDRQGSLQAISYIGMTNVALSSLRWIWPLLGALGCVSDFSPDPYNDAPSEKTRDAGGGREGTSGQQQGSRPSRSEKPSTPEQDSESVDDGSGSGEGPAEDVDPDDGSVTPGPEGQPGAPPAGPCDLSGRWIMTERTMTTALLAKQLNRAWFYLELTQNGDQVSVARSVACGDTTEGLYPIEVVNDDSKAWPAYDLRDQYKGRKGKSTKSANGCEVSFEKRAFVRGASVPAYLDLSIPLPTLPEKATDDEPGWEDWDNDGQPGVTMKVSGTISGALYTATRTWTEYKGVVAANARSFRLPLSWAQERVNYGYTSEQLATPADRDPDAAQHLAEYARLADDQATGNETAICKAIRQLAPTLTPLANKK